MAIANTSRFNTGPAFSFMDPRAQRPGYAGSPLHDWQAELDKQGYFANQLGQQGYLGIDTQSDLARSLYNRFEQGYSASLFNNPDMKWTDYLDQYRGKIGHVMAGMDPQSRGVRSNQYVGGARWLPRGN